MPFDSGKADRAVNFFERVLHHPKGQYAGKPFILASEWQRPLIRRLFGEVDEDGFRTTRRCYVEVPKKNGKTELGAGIGLYCLLADHERAAEIYAAATAREQAAKTWRVAAAMVRSSAMLSNQLRVIDSTHTVVKRDDPLSFFKTISCDGDIQDGMDPHCVIVDELHRWHTGKALALWQILQRSGIARRQPLNFAITTAGVQDESPLAWQAHEYERQIREGLFDDKNFLGAVWGAGEKDDWTDPATWVKANPSHEAHAGGFLKHKTLLALYEEARNNPAEQPGFKRFHLNIWGQEANRAIDMKQWAACSAPLRPLVDRPCFAGLDLSATTDLTALVLVFPAEDDSFDFLPFFWMPADNVRKLELKDKVPYSQWAREGFLETTPGNVIDYRAVRAKLTWARELFEVRDVAFDPWSATQLSLDLIDDGFRCVPIRQNYTMLSEPTKLLLKLVAAGKIRHAGHPVLKWNADCLSTKGDEFDNIRPVKPERSQSPKRIDGILAAIMALSRWVAERNGGSVYDRRGIMVLG